MGKGKSRLSIYSLPANTFSSLECQSTKSLKKTMISITHKWSRYIKNSKSSNMKRKTHRDQIVSVFYLHFTNNGYNVYWLYSISISLWEFPVCISPSSVSWASSRGSSHQEFLRAWPHLPIPWRMRAHSRIHSYFFWSSDSILHRSTHGDSFDIRASSSSGSWDSSSSWHSQDRSSRLGLDS